MTELALSIADQAAEIRITSYCVPESVSDTRWWWVPPDDDIEDAEVRADVIEAVEYLELRGRIERDSRYPARVRIIEPAG